MRGRSGEGFRGSARAGVWRAPCVCRHVRFYQQSPDFIGFGTFPRVEASCRRCRLTCSGSGSILLANIGDPASEGGSDQPSPVPRKVSSAPLLAEPGLGPVPEAAARVWRAVTGRAASGQVTSDVIIVLAPRAHATVASPSPSTARAGDGLRACTDQPTTIRPELQRFDEARAEASRWRSAAADPWWSSGAHAREHAAGSGAGRTMLGWAPVLLCGVRRVLVRLAPDPGGVSRSIRSGPRWVCRSVLSQSGPAGSSSGCSGSTQWRMPGSGAGRPRCPGCCVVVGRPRSPRNVTMPAS